MAIDYYAEAREIAMCLEREGLITEAQALTDAMQSGSTGTEILMALRWQLDRIERASPTTSAQTRRRIRDLSEAITTALGG